MKKIILIISIIFFNGLASFAQNYELINKLVQPAREADDEAGYNVAISGDYAAFCSTYDDLDENGMNPIIGSGSVHVFKKGMDGKWTYLQKIADPQRNLYENWDGHGFGRGLSMSGTTMAVGAFRDAGDENGANKMAVAGAVYMYELENGNWIFKQKLVPSDRSVGDLFGNYVAISGNYLIASSYKDSTDVNNANPLYYSGSAYIFERDNNGSWIQKQKITASSRVTGDQFGFSVAISSDGYALVGAPFHDFDTLETNSVVSSGAAYLYQRDLSGSWNLIKKLVSTNREYDGRYGMTVAMSHSTFLVGAQVEDAKTGTGVLKQNCGAAYLYSINGDKVSGPVRLLAPDRDDGDSYGCSIDISDEIIIVGAFGQKEDADSLNPLVNAGCAYVYKNDGNGNYTFLQKLYPPKRTQMDLFGSRSAVSSKTIIVGAYFNDFDENEANEVKDAGAAYIFAPDNITNIKEQTTNPFSVFPNPSSEQIYVVTPESSPVHLIDYTGRTVKSFFFNAGSHEINLRGLQPGLYFIEAGKFGTRNIIIQ